MWIVSRNILKKWGKNSGSNEIIGIYEKRDVIVAELTKIYIKENQLSLAYKKLVDEAQKIKNIFRK